jgi:hypothetical protein
MIPFKYKALVLIMSKNCCVGSTGTCVYDAAFCVAYTVSRFAPTGFLGKVNVGPKVVTKDIDNIAEQAQSYRIVITNYFIKYFSNLMLSLLIL